MLPHRPSYRHRPRLHERRDLVDIYKRITHADLGKASRGGLVRPGLARAPPRATRPGIRAPGAETELGRCERSAQPPATIRLTMIVMARC